jgi:cytochrome c-type biogenesis protein
MADLGTPALAGLAFSAGTATFFAPCAFPLLPGYVSYFLGDTASTVAAGTTHDAENVGGRAALVGRIRGPLARALLVSVVAGLGMVTVYVGLTALAATLGAAALSDIAVLELVVGVVFVVAGSAMAAGWKVSRSLVQLPERRRTVTGFFAFGVLYATAAAGCTAPLFLAVVLKGVSSGPVAAVTVAGAYALGMCAVLLGVTGASALGGSSLASRLSAHTGRIYRVAGGLLALSGAAEIYYYAYGFPEVTL